jgi:drug/metabolite transporter (DMT)-like permease
MKKPLFRILITAAVILGVLISSTIQILSKNAQNQSNSQGIDGRVRPFQHPWFQTWLMFIGEALCLILFAFYRFCCSKSTPSQEKFKKKRSSPILMVLPAMCDFAATSLGGIAFLYIVASVWLLLRSALIIFSAILSIIFLKRKLYAYHWIGMSVIVIGLSLVGLSALLSKHQQDNTHFMDMVFGIFLLMASLLIAAFQFTFEESLLKHRGFHALQVVGYEGLFGTIIMTVLILPLFYAIPGPNVGSFENSLDALIQIKNSNALLLFILIYVVSSTLANFFSVQTGKLLNTIQRMIVTNAVLTAVLWGCDLFIYYVVSPTFGEGWNEYSWIQVVGFVIVTFGMLFYNSALKIPYLNCNIDVKMDEKEDPSVNPTDSRKEESKPLI